MSGGTDQTRSSPEGHRMLILGAVLLGLAGSLKIIIGLVLFILPGFRDFLGVVPNVIQLGILVLLVVIGAIEIIGAWYAYERRHWWRILVTGMLGSITFVTFPLDVIAALLIALSEREFK